MLRDSLTFCIPLRQSVSTNFPGPGHLSRRQNLVGERRHTTRRRTPCHNPSGGHIFPLSWRCANQQRVVLLRFWTHGPDFRLLGSEAKKISTSKGACFSSHISVLALELTQEPLEDLCLNLGCDAPFEPLLCSQDQSKSQNARGLNRRLSPQLPKKKYLSISGDGKGQNQSSAQPFFSRAFRPSVHPAFPH